MVDLASMNGLLLEGRWRIERRIEGEDGTGGVRHEGRDEKTGRPVIVRLLGSAWVPQAVIEERRLRALVAHPAFARILDVGVAPSTTKAFVVEERSDGRSLDDLFRLGPADVLEGVTIARALLSAQQAAFEKGILLERIDPAAVLVAHDEAGIRVRLLCSLSEKPERWSQNLDRYAGPERLSHTAVPPSVESAVYRMASLIYRMLTGTLPFDGDSLLALVAAIREKKPAPIRTELGVPLSVQQALWRALEKEPTHRYHRFDDFAAALSL